MTDEFFGEFKSFLISTATERGFDGPNLHFIVAIMDQLYALPNNELNAWFYDKDGDGWETILGGMVNCVSNYIRTRHLADSKWILGNQLF